MTGSKKKLPVKSTDKSIDRKQLTDNELLIELKKLWTKGKRGKTNLYELLRTKFKIEKSRALKMYDVMERVATKEAKQGQSEANVKSNKKAVQNGLKLVTEIDMRLQNVIFNDKNTTSDQLKAIDLYYKRNGHYAAEKKDLTVNGFMDFLKGTSNDK